jgi:SRP54-type protein, GTPase domain
MAYNSPGYSRNSADLSNPVFLSEQVGAALSMVYTSGAPIMFCGVGQTYVDLKRLNVKSVVHSLLK